MDEITLKHIKKGQYKEKIRFLFFFNLMKMNSTSFFYYVSLYNGIYVITGGILSNDLKTIGKENVSVPNYFYKILMTKDGSKMIAFLVPHNNSNQPLYEFVTSVDVIEKMTEIDFFPKLEDTSEQKFESNSDYKNWSF